MARLARLLLPVVVPVACLAIGSVAGYSYREARIPRVLARATENREGGFRYVNPLLECDVGGDLVQSPELTPFREKVVAHLATLRYPGVDDISVYFRELNDGLWFSIGDEGRYAAASLRKVPIMIAALKQAESAPELLLRKIRNDLQQDLVAQQNVKPSVQLVRGEEYTLAELIRRMIVYSDNDAAVLVSREVDPVELGRTYAKLDPHGTEHGMFDFQSVFTYASFFRVLYNASYLNRQLSEWALGVLAASEFRSGLVEGVPPGVPVAHKFGEALEDPRATRVQLHDCGIVYAPERPYLLCIMSRGTSFEFLDDAIASTSRVIFEAVVTQNASR
jgi:beta-lactamase class A